MHFKNVAFAAAVLGAGAAADFIVITDYPKALETLSPQQAESWISANLPKIQSDLFELATQPSYIAAATSVIPELRGFAATATVSIPAVVTAIDGFTIFTAVPTWYSELPSGVRSFYDDAAKRVENFLELAVPSEASTSSSSSAVSSGALISPTAPANSSASVSPTGNVTIPAITPSGSTPPESTGKAGKVEIGVTGAGVVAGLVGVLMM